MSEPEPEQGSSEEGDYVTLPSKAADDVTVGGWLDVNPSAAAESSSDVEVPVAKPGLWDQIKRALRAKP